MNHEMEGREESGRCLFDILSRHFPGGTEETTKRPCRNSAVSRRLLIAKAVTGIWPWSHAKLKDP